MAHTLLTPARDSAALFQSPAALAGIERGDFYFMHNRMYAGMKGVAAINQGFISAGMPTRIGTFGFGVGMFRAAGLLEERTLAVTYARRLGSRLEVGVTGKQLYHGYLTGGDSLAAADPIFRNGRDKSAWAADLGIIGKVTDPLRLGVTVRNLNNPDVGLVVEDRVPREIQAGAFYDFGPRYHVRATDDVTFRDDGLASVADRVIPAVGIEKGFADPRVVFRMGLTPLELTAGFGVRLGAVGLDYALVLRRNLVEGTMGTHMLGLRLRFGGVSR